MKLCLQFVLIFGLAVSSAFGTELAILHNGFSIRHEKSEIVGTVTRLYLGTDRTGFFGVLHTWGRTLEYHPHVHYVVPGGGVSEDGNRWLPSRTDFFVPEKALSILFRAKFRDLLTREGLLGQDVAETGGSV